MLPHQRSNNGWWYIAAPGSTDSGDYYEGYMAMARFENVARSSAHGRVRGLPTTYSRIRIDVGG